MVKHQQPGPSGQPETAHKSVSRADDLVETSDVLFALDSIPAVFGVTADPFIVYTSNIFAILGLRSLYFLLAKVVQHFAYLKIGLAIILFGRLIVAFQGSPDLFK